MMLRLLIEQDIPTLVDIEIATQFSPWSQDTFEKCLLFGSQAWVIEKDQQVIGFIFLFAKANEGHILNLGVHPTHQRQGYGELLMQTVLHMAEIEALHSIYLEVRCSNQPAIALYEKLGFQRIGIRKDYYISAQSREDAFVFEKKIVL